jgi:hypothetical protein
MADALTTITELIQSPPGQLAAGFVLAGIVWKFFERVESVLSENTKLEIAVWLLGVKVGQKLEPWPDTFVVLFDRVFGVKHFSWRCITRSSIITLTVHIGLYTSLSGPSVFYQGLSSNFRFIVLVFIGAVCFDYLCLWFARQILASMRRRSLSVLWLPLHVLLSIAFAVSFLAVYFPLLVVLRAYWIGTLDVPLAIYRSMLAQYVHLLVALWSKSDIFGLVRLLQPSRNRSLHVFFPFVVSCLVTSAWLWLYAGSGFILKAARRFDIGFEWFNRKFDIEKKPLQSIGLVAGALVAVVYWAAVIVSHFV